jgi:predicted RNA-binding protein YlqC (UPF0109 family)
MSSIDQQFVEFIVKSLVGNPDKVTIERSVDEKGVLLELLVDPEDLGRVIGKRGATAQSIRTLLRALGTKNEARYNLKIIDTAEQADDKEANSSSNDKAASKQEPEESTEQPTEETDTNNQDSSEEESSSLKKAKQELADLDDLDI